MIKTAKGATPPKDLSKCPGCGWHWASCCHTTVRCNEAAAERREAIAELRARSAEDLKVRVSKKSLQAVGDAITSAKIRAMCPSAEDDEISVPLVDGISYAQLAQLSAALGTADIYVDVMHGDPGSPSVPRHDHAVLTIRWSQQVPKKLKST